MKRNKQELRQRERESKRNGTIARENHENILQQIKYCCQAVNQVENYEKQPKRNYERKETKQEQK